MKTRSDARLKIINDKHLLWWVFKALQTNSGISLSDLQSTGIWDYVQAPDWVLPAMKEKLAEFQKPVSDEKMEALSRIRKYIDVREIKE